MKKIFLAITIVMLTSMMAQSQHLYFTRNGKITFYSKTPAEDIDAVNNQVASKINSKTGELEFQLLIKGFTFKKSAMQDHFNDKDYMNSDAFPKASFKGKLTDVTKVDFAKDGSYTVSVEGELTMHGVTQKINVTAIIKISGGKVNATSSFKVKLKDYNISVPSFVNQKVAETVEVQVNCDYELYQPAK